MIGSGLLPTLTAATSSPIASWPLPGGEEKGAHARTNPYQVLPHQFTRRKESRTQEDKYVYCSQTEPGIVAEKKQHRRAIAFYYLDPFFQDGGPPDDSSEYQFSVPCTSAYPHQHRGRTDNSPGTWLVFPRNSTTVSHRPSRRMSPSTTSRRSWLLRERRLDRSEHGRGTPAAADKHAACRVTKGVDSRAAARRETACVASGASTQSTARRCGAEERSSSPVLAV